MYTAQINAHGNVIVCKGNDVRNSYRICYTGSYADCLKIKLQGAEADVRFVAALLKRQNVIDGAF